MREIAEFSIAVQTRFQNGTSGCSASITGKWHH